MTGELSADQLQQLYLCSLLLGRKREQPIFSCKAHVFHIDPKTKRSWIPASGSAVSVSFFYDSTRSLYRIISVEGTKAVINSTITPNMTFTKTSQKFGQWSDVRANTVYGLGFSSEAELNKFIEKFSEVKEATRLAAAKANSNGTGATPVTSANASPITSRAGPRSLEGTGDGLPDTPLPAPPQHGPATSPAPPTSASANASADAALKTALVAHQRSQSLSGLQPGESPKHQAKTPGGGNDSKPPPVPNSNAQQPNLPSGSAEGQLKYENDRLKLALAQSSANAKKWEVELATLKNNNVRLTSALQESTANVDEWKRQLHSYKEENQRMKTRYLELEASKGSADAAAELRKELQNLRSRVENLDIELKMKDDELKRLSANKSVQHEITRPSMAEERCKNLEQENAELQAGVSLAQAQLETAISAQDSQRRVLDTLNSQLASRVQELAGIHREIATALQT